MGKRILILSNHFITLFNFRKELIRRFIEDGHDVLISIPPSESNAYFSDMGCTILETPVDRRGMNPLADAKLLLRYLGIMKTWKPDIIFSYTIKPNIYGSIASNLLKKRQVSNITGTGGTFLRENTVSKVATLLYRNSVRHAYKVYFQNEGDRDLFRRKGMIGENYELIPGSGVNLEQYAYCDFPKGEDISFIYIGRIMALKGIDEYLACARHIRRTCPETRFYVAGFIEEEKYERIIRESHDRGEIIYLGFQKDIKPWIQKAQCTILPSHGGEGIPNVLLETAATGRACIASRIDGSREVVTDGVNGYLFEAGQADDLIHKAETFLEQTEAERERMGRAGREKVEKAFNRNLIIETYLREVELLEGEHGEAVEHFPVQPKPDR